MKKVSLRKLKKSDIRYFRKWWQDKALAKLTSGRTATLEEIPPSFNSILKSSDIHRMIVVGNKVIGHIALNKRRNGWHESDIVIGEKSYWGKGYGTEAKLQLLLKAKRLGIKKVFAEVRPDNLRSINASLACGFVKKKTHKGPSKNLPLLLRMEKVL